MKYHLNLVTGCAQIFLTSLSQRFKVVTTVLLNSSILWDITPCRLAPIHIIPHNITSHKTQKNLLWISLQLLHCYIPFGNWHEQEFQGGSTPALYIYMEDTRFVSQPGADYSQQVFCSFPQPLHTNSMKAPQINPQQPPSTSLPCHHSPIITPFGAT